MTGEGERDADPEEASLTTGAPDPGQLVSSGARADSTLHFTRGDDAGFTLPPAGLLLGKEIGRGGYGKIREAMQTVFRRPVAVKTLLPTERNKGRLAGFYAEAVVTAFLQHPNIVPIYDLHEDDGECRLVMKRIDGVNWQRLLHPATDADRELAAGYGLDDHLDILLKVCDAVAFANAQGVLHRDIKPSNVMIGDFGEVLLLDWGCAITIGSCRLPGVFHLDEVSRVQGTPAYMSPEAARVAKKHIGPTSDVYLLGGVLYEILTGTLPHDGGGGRETIRNAAKGQIVPPETRAPDRDIPAELAAICMRALRKDPAKRLASAREFAARLKRYGVHREANDLTRRAWVLARKAPHSRQPLEVYARAIACLEQALEVWPRCGDARRGLARIGLAYAEAAFSAQAYAVARARARAVAKDAAAIDDDDRVAKAKELEGRIDQRVAAEERQRRSHRRLRRLAVLLVLLILAGLAAATVWTHRSLQRLQDEQDKRLQAQAVALPMWYERAEAAQNQGQWEEAADYLATVASIDLGAPRLLRLRLQQAIGTGARARARNLLPSYLAADAPDRPQAADRIRTWLASDTDNPLDDEERRRLTRDLTALGMPAAARGLAADHADRIAVYRRLIRARHPKARFDLDVGPDQSLHLIIDHIDDLSGLASLPVVSCRIDTDITDLSPLRDWPLQRLHLAAREVRDLSPLIGLPMQSLVLEQTRVTDLSPIATPGLHELILDRNRDLRDLEPVGSMAGLQRFAYHPDNKIRRWDPQPLAGTAISDLELHDIATISDTAILANLPLRHLRLHHCTWSDWSWLRGAALESLTLVDCPDPPDLTTLDLSTLTSIRLHTDTPVDLSRIALPSLTRVALRGDATLDLTPLAACHLDRLDLDPGLPATSMSTLLDQDQLLICLDGHPTPQFASVYRLLHALTGNDDLTVLDRARFDDGQLQRLDLSDLPISELTRLSSFTALRDLDLTGTTARDLTPLGTLSLHELRLDFTPVADLAPLHGKWIKHLDCLGIAIPPGAAYAPLAHLGKRNPWLALLAGTTAPADYRRAHQTDRNGRATGAACYLVMYHALRGETAAAAAELEALTALPPAGRDVAARLVRLRSWLDAMNAPSE